MTEFLQHKPGTFTWAELATSDTVAVKGFYGSVFGWTYEDQPMQDDMVYTLFNQRGRAVAATYPQMPAQVAQKAPPAWGLHVTVGDLDASLTSVAELGGKVLAGPFQVGHNGRMATIMDPSGASLTLWQALEHIGAGYLGEPGSITWTELMTSNIDACLSFYSGLFGWGMSRSKMPGGQDYFLFHLDGETIAGMMHKPEDMAQVPSAWMVYFGSADCTATMEAADDAGGAILVPPMVIPGTGTFAVLQDPQGALFSILEAEPMGRRD